MNPLWSQHYYIWEQGLAFSAMVAALPVAVLLVLLGILRKPAWMAGLCGLTATMVVALVGYRMPPALAVSSAAYGAAFGLFPISWIVFWAIVLYNVTVSTGKFTIIKDSLGSLTPDLRIQAVIIAFGFGGFLEGAAGFGTPVAVAAAMMVGLGFSPYYASALCLLANTAPVAFGSIGIPVITLAAITGLPVEKLSGAVGTLCAPIAFILPAYMITVMGGLSAAVEVWPVLLAGGVTFGTMEYVISNFVGAQLSDILSSTSSMAAVILLLRFWRPRPRAVSSIPNGEPGPFDGPAKSSAAAEIAKHSAGQIASAWMPYVFVVILVLLWGYKPFQTILNLATIGIHWPELHNLVLRTPPVLAKTSPYAALFNLNFISASGTACMIASILSAIFLRMRPAAFARTVAASARQLALSILTIAVVLAMAFVMNYSGATGTLGLAFAATGAAFPFFSAFLGWLGVFLTGSDTSSNALFGGLQSITAEHLGFSRVLMAASNSAGGVLGKMISLQSIAVAAAATGITVRQQSQLIRFTLKHSLFLAALVGLEVLILAYWIRIV
jgi:lactate permease